MALISLPMVLLITLRISTLSISLVILRNYGKFYGIIVVATLAFLVLVSIRQFYKLDPRRALIGAVASIIAPCIVFGEHTTYYLVVNFSISVLYLLISIALPFLVFFVPVFDSNHTDVFNISLYQNQTLQVCI